MTLRTAAMAVGLCLTTSAMAVDEAEEETSDLPIPTMKIQRVAPSSSFEFGAQFSFGTVTYWRDFVPAWPGMGLRAGWGKNFDNHRLGLDTTLTMEGPFGVHTSLFLEPVAAWYLITDGGLLLGASAGPALMYHVRNDIVASESGYGVAPSGTLKVGWSQSWTRVGRRMFVFLEPKLRYLDGKMNPRVALVFGSGMGR